MLDALATMNLNIRYKDNGSKISLSKQGRAVLASVPETAPAAPTEHPKLGKYSDQWTYRNVDGNALFYVCRFDTKDGKDFRPLSFVDGAWRWKGLAAPRPLFGLNRLAEHPTKTVIVYEGDGERNMRVLHPEALHFRLGTDKEHAGVLRHVLPVHQTLPPGKIVASDLHGQLDAFDLEPDALSR